MQITANNSAGAATIAVAGSLNTSTAPELEHALEGILPDTASIVFDFHELEYISSAGLRVIMVAYKHTADTGGSIRVEGANDEVLEILEVTGFSNLFDVC